jgi:ABC-type multidrug transport system ATPase subunit
LLSTRVDELSGGQRQVINILLTSARAMPPLVVILDEPFNNLDSANIAVASRLIESLRASGKAILLTTHSYRGLLTPDDCHELTFLDSNHAVTRDHESSGRHEHISKQDRKDS